MNTVDEITALKAQLQRLKRSFTVGLILFVALLGVAAGQKLNILDMDGWTVRGKDGKVALEANMDGLAVRGKDGKTVVEANSEGTVKASKFIVDGVDVAAALNKAPAGLKVGFLDIFIAPDIAKVGVLDYTAPETSMSVHTIKIDGKPVIKGVWWYPYNPLHGRMELWGYILPNPHPRLTDSIELQLSCPKNAPRAHIRLMYLYE